MDTATRPQALLFDVFGTLVDWRSSTIRDIRHVLATDLAEHVRPEMVADAWRARYQPSLEQVRSGARPFVLLDVLHRESLDAVLADLGVQPLAPAVREWLADSWCRLDPWPDVVGGLDRLRHGPLLAALSNGSVGMMARLAQYADLRWHTILGAQPAGAYKPAARVYLTAAEWLGVAPGRCMMVAAHATDIRVAAELGFQTAFVRRPTEHGPDRPGDQPPTVADVVVDQLHELADHLGC